MKILVLFALVILVSTISINDVFADHETSIKPTSPSGLIQTCGPNSPDCRNYPISKSESIVFEMHASGVYSPIGRFEISIDNQLSQFRNDGSCENGSCSSAITVTKIRENVHQIVINAQNLTDGDHTIKIDSINWIDGVVGGGKRTLTATYQFFIGNPNPQDGSFVLPCSMQEKGDGVSSSSCYGFYQNSIARAEVGIKYNTGLFPITNYKAVGFFIDKNGNQGQNITVTLDKINPGESKTLVFTNPTTGFVSQFKMQMLGGTLVTSTDTDGDGILDSLDSCPTQKETVNGYQDTDGCPDVVPPPTDTDGDGIPNSIDICVTQPETLNGYQDTDGCPDTNPATTDTDGDGISDSIDQCPTQPETVNGYQDTDGCPDVVPNMTICHNGNTLSVASPAVPAHIAHGDTLGACVAPVDTDGDGITDSNDECPTKAEIVNGFKDTDGCPDVDEKKALEDKKAADAKKAEDKKATDAKKAAQKEIDDAKKAAQKEIADAKKAAQKEIDNAKKLADKKTIDAKKTMADKEIAAKKTSDAKKLAEKKLAEKKAEKIKLAKEKANKVAEAKKSKK